MKAAKIIVFIVFFIFLIVWFFMVSQKKMEEFYYAQASMSLQRVAIVIPIKQEDPTIETESEAAISTRINSLGKEKILFQKEIYKGLPIASLTKLMTAIIALENYSEQKYNLDSLVNISEKAANQSNVSASGNLVVNEKLSIKELLDLVLIYSSNDSAFALSEIIGEDFFIQKMNEKALEIGLINTHFINSTGLDPKDKNIIPNYSTVKDLVAITKYILENHPIIFETTLKKGDYTPHNGLSSLSFSNNQQLIGGKTGYTLDAGGCLLIVFKNNQDHTFINIILGSLSPEKRIEEMQKLINWNI